MKPWHNTCTRLAFHSLIEEWSDLEALALHAKDQVNLAVKIHDGYQKAFESIPSPFLRHACMSALRHVNFRQVAEQLLRMLARQQQHQANRPHQKGESP